MVYHTVCPAKYRRVVFDDEVDQELRRICLENARRYEIEFLEIGTDRDHMHFPMQLDPTYSPTKIMRTVKSLAAREIFKRLPRVKEKLWGGKL